MSTQVRRPADFDPAEFPILARHYGIEPSRPVDQITADAVGDLHLRCEVQRLHRIDFRTVGAALGLAGSRGS